MTDVRPFRAFRYDLGRVGALSDVIAPPYDVIDPALQQALYDRSPYNVIRLILNREETSDSDKDNRYTRAARTLREWQASGIIAQDSARCLYVYQQEFEIDGQQHTRTGFLARVRLEAFGAGSIYAHEETLSGPKADRLKLFRATAMNLSPIFGIYPDDAGEVQAQLDDAIRGVLPLEATDHLGVVSRLWPVDNQRICSAITGSMGPKPVFIADGHHRYETGLAYLHERKAAGEVTTDEAAANFIMMMLVGMNDPGLVIMPTHRLLNAGRAITSDDVRTALGKACRVDYVGRGEEGARKVWDLIETDGSQNVLGFGTAADNAWQIARFDCAHQMAELVPEHGPDWRGLAVSVLHVLVFDRLLKPFVADQPPFSYVHRVDEAVDAIAKKQCALAALVPPATMEHVQKIAGNLEKMPPKSTYFYPKLLSGLVFNSLATS